MTPAEAIAARVRATNLRAETALASLKVPGTKIDPWLFALAMGAILARLSRTAPNKVDDWQEAPLSRWVPAVNAQLAEWRQSSTPAPGAPIKAQGAPTVLDAEHVASVAFPQLAAPVEARELPPLAKPEAPGPGGVTQHVPQGGDATPPSIGDSSPLAIIPSPPPGMPERLREAWIEARTRAGQYCRGLGNIAESEASQVVQEIWNGEDIAHEVDPEKRAKRMRQIRELTAEAIARGKTPQWLASELGHVTGEWSRDWLRIARTELQSANNEGVAIEAFRADGVEARVARVPEPGACPDCLRLFMDGSKPRIFTVEELVANGTNVGKKRAAWVAVLGPVHPNCLCVVQYIPPGLEYNDRWELVKE